MYRLKFSAGFSLLEVVVAMAILSFGLLGVASLHMVSLQNTNNAYLRAQSVLISDDLIERVRNNPKLLAYAKKTAIDSKNDFNGSTEADPNQNYTCEQASGCPLDILIKAELADWTQSLKRVGDISTSATQTTPPVHVILSYLEDDKVFKLVINWKSQQWDSTSGGSVTREKITSSYEFLVAVNR